MLKRTLLLAVAIALLVVGGVVAQDEAESACTAETDDAVLTEIEALIAEARSGDADVMDALLSVKSTIVEYDSTCSGLSWTSEEEGLQPLLGPVVIPEGVYRLTATTTGYIIVEATVLSGQCDDRLLFAESRGEANDGAQILFESEGCEVMFEFDNISEPWTFAFERIQ